MVALDMWGLEDGRVWLIRIVGGLGRLEEREDENERELCTCMFIISHFLSSISLCISHHARTHIIIPSQLAIPRSSSRRV